MKDVPEALRMWLSMPTMDDAFEDYRSWERCLADSFGPRKFVPLNITPAEVYPSAKKGA
jgi:hypothetical protein